MLPVKMMVIYLSGNAAFVSYSQVIKTMHCPFSTISNLDLIIRKRPVKSLNRARLNQLKSVKHQLIAENVCLVSSATFGKL